MKTCAVPLLMALALLASPANACKLPASSAKKDISPIVVDGEAICRIAEERCTIEVSRVVKGNLRPRHTSSITVLVARDPNEDPLDFRCGGPWMLTKDDQFVGRFYLKSAGKDLYQPAFLPDAAPTAN